MKYLLDTHIFLWAAEGREELVTEIAEVLVRPDHELWLSSISVWEIAVLAEKGRIELEWPPRRWLETALRRMPVREIAIDHRIALRSRELVLSHEDPADRFLAATAAVYDMTLVTADRKLIGSDEYRVLAHP